MRCQKRPAADCPTPERCELLGCTNPYGLAPSTAVALERQPIDLDYKPGRLMRGLMALTDAGERAVRRGPTPFAALPEPAPDPDLLREVAAVMSAPDPAPPPAPAAPAAPTLQDGLRIIEIPGPAYVVYLGDKPLGMTQRFERLGPAR